MSIFDSIPFLKSINDIVNQVNDLNKNTTNFFNSVFNYWLTIRTVAIYALLIFLIITTLYIFFFVINVLRKFWEMTRYVLVNLATIIRNLAHFFPIGLFKRKKIILDQDPVKNRFFLRKASVFIKLFDRDHVYSMAIENLKKLYEKKSFERIEETVINELNNQTEEKKGIIKYRGRRQLINEDNREKLNEWLNNNRFTELKKEIKTELSLLTGLSLEQVEQLVKYQRRKMLYNEFRLGL